MLDIKHTPLYSRDYIVNPNFTNLKMTVTIGDKTLPFPIVSFEPFLKGSPKERQAVAKELYDAFHNYGWVYLKDFGISEAEVDAMFATVNVLPSQESRSD